MSSCEHVPDELWLAIFELLPRESIQQLCLSARRFSAISRPLLFGHLPFHPCLTHHFPEPICSRPPSPQYTQFALDRLNFWSSDEIAPMVRECTISPVYRTWEPSDSPDPWSLLATFFERIVKFSALRIVRAQYACFSQQTLAALCRLPCLDHVTVEQCGVHEQGRIQTRGMQLRTSRFHYRKQWGGSNRGLHLWIPLLDPDHLRELKITSFPASAHMPPGAPFPNVYKLDAELDCKSASEVVAAWARFPAVRVLKFYTGMSTLAEAEAARAADILPLLEEYFGDLRPLPLIPSRPTLKRLVLDHCYPRELALCLGGMANSLHITSLHAAMSPYATALSAKSFRAICKCLPKLVDMHIEILISVTRMRHNFGARLEVAERASSLFSSLVDTPALSPTLQQLAITWKFNEGPEGLYSLFVEMPDLDFSRLRDSLVEKCPDLKTLWLDGNDFIFGWRRSSDGRVDREEEASERVFTGTGYRRLWDHKKDLRAKFAAFWGDGVDCARE
ncbi:hypothetical protein FB45DRAFT_1053430 [Roridomyces roridus]|uniref:F-box domain-containing protein n=1 Tax=Roridomyces roridus TaxID=1738132 RepID=A0AAD7CC44_9AGAR|nr:hypothetical protein FB45DRAFT_1053430 [Roridomyces roridus]